MFDSPSTHSKILITPEEIKHLTSRDAYDEKKWMILVSIRHHLDLSVYDVASILCVPTAAYIQWENGARFPNCVIKLLCLETGLPVNDYMSTNAYFSTKNAEYYARKEFERNHPNVTYSPIYKRKPSEIERYKNKYPGIRLTINNRSVPEGTSFDDVNDAHKS